MNSKINNFINGKFITSKSDLITVWSPQDGKKINGSNKLFFKRFRSSY